MDTGQEVSVLLLDTAELMAVGMGVVFSFLLLLVWAVQAMSWLLRHSAGPVAEPSALIQHSSIPPAVVAAISAAVEHHNKHNKGSK
jgi:oxaloacetate decarboxylase (Na+ extruding) subunit gamma